MAEAAASKFYMQEKPCMLLVQMQSDQTELRMASHLVIVDEVEVLKR